MTAYELAKYWENEAIVMSKTTAHMLRQQADEIELLKRNMNTATDELLQQTDRIAELEEEILDLKGIIDIMENGCP